MSTPGKSQSYGCSMKQSVRVLCVDDDQQLLSVTTELLQCEGYEVAAVTSGRAAVAQIGKQFDLVIVDYNLPDINGDVVAEHWKRDHPSVPILMVSGCPNLPPHALDHVNAHLAKGGWTDLFLRAISELTKTARRRSVVDPIPGYARRNVNASVGRTSIGMVDETESLS
jgi:CheY-like chemotaxis protein